MEESPKVGPYSLLRKISVSDIAVSFAADIPTDSRTRRVVALKIIDPECSADEAFANQLARDTKLVQGLNHINIGQTWDLCERDGAHYLCLEYIEGASLRALLDATGPAPAPVAAFVTSEIAAALSYAHARKSKEDAPDGIIHGDLRPRKVIVSRTGAVKLVDFAVSRARKFTDADPVPVDRREPEIMAYTSPSVARGGIPSDASDLFSAAAIGYRLLVGRRIYNGRTFEDVHGQAIEGTFPRLREIAPDCPKELAQIIMRGLGASDKPNFPSAQAFRSALSSWIRKNAVGFGRHKVKEHFGDELKEANTGRGARPLSRREFKAVDRASLIHSDIDAEDDSGSISPAEVYGHRLKDMPDKDTVIRVLGSSAGSQPATPADEGDDGFGDEMPVEGTQVAQNPNPHLLADNEPRGRTQTQAISPQTDIDELEFESSGTEGSIASESSGPPAPPSQGTDKSSDDQEEYRETLKDGRSHADKAVEDMKSDTSSLFDDDDEEDEDEGKPSALDELMAGSSLASSGASKRQGTQQFSPSDDIFDEEISARDESTATGAGSETPDKPSSTVAGRHTQEIDPGVRSATEAMGTVDEVFDEEEPPQRGGAAFGEESRYVEERRQATSKRTDDASGERSYQGADTAVPSTSRRPGAEDQVTEVSGQPRSEYLSSASDAETAIYDPSRSSDTFTDSDDIDLRKPGRGSLGYVIIFLAFVGLGVGAWYLYKEIQDIQATETVAESQGVFVTSRPQGAQIIIDDRNTNKTTPALVDIEEVGTQHRVTVEMAGYEQPTTKQITSSAERRAEADFALEPLPHLIHVESQPSGADVFLNGEKVGTTPADIGPVRQDPRQGVDLLLIHPDGGRKVISHQWTPGTERSSVSANLSQGTTVQ
jgi:hypothetical protein